MVASEYLERNTVFIGSEKFWKTLYKRDSYFKFSASIVKAAEMGCFFMLTVNPVAYYYKIDYLYQLSIKYSDSDYELTLHF